METVLTVKNMILGKWNPLLGQVLRREMRLRRSCGEWALGHFGAATLNWRTWEQQGKLLEATGNVSENRNGGFKSSRKAGRNIVGCHRWFWWPSNGWQTWKSCPRCVTRQRRPVGRAVKAMDETEMTGLNKHIGDHIDFLQNCHQFWWFPWIFANFGDFFIENFSDSLKFSLFLVNDFSPILVTFPVSKLSPILAIFL